MQYYCYVNIFAGVTCVCLALVVWLRAPGALLNRTCSGLLLCLAVWSLSLSVVHNRTASLRTALLFENIGASGWLFFSTFHLWFAMVFARRQRLYRSRVLVPMLFLVPGVFLARQWSHGLLHDYRLQSFGWIGAWERSPWTFSFYTHYLATVLWGLGMIVAVARTSTGVRRRQALILVVSTVTPLFLGTLSNVAMRLAGVFRLPPMGDVFALFFGFGTVYAISRYRFLSMTPMAAADRIISTMSDMLVLLDVDGRIVSANRAALASLDYEKEELEGQDLAILFGESRESRGAARDVAAGKTGELPECEFLCRGGGPVPVSIAVAHLAGTGTVLIARDISPQRRASQALLEAKEALERTVDERTRELREANEEARRDLAERRKVEKELRESEERLKILFENAPDALYLSDLTGKFIDGNRQAERLVGCAREEVIGKSFLELDLLPASHIARAAGLLARNAIGMPTGPDEFELKTIDGRRVHAEISTHPVKIGGKRLVLAVARDIGRRIIAQEERAALEERLRQSEKMRAIGQLAGGIAHDFNNMLGAISGYAELLQRKFGGTNEKIDRYAGMIGRSAARAADLTAKLLAFTRKGEVSATAVDLHDIVRETVELLDRTIDKNITIRCDLAAIGSTVIGDHGQLVNALLNLGVNARDAMPGGGLVSFITGVESVTEDRASRFRELVHTGEYVVLTVSDTGEGMDSETLQHVFEPFFTTKGRGKGTGLGLATVYGTVRSHQGAIDIESTEGKGTTVRVYLPRVREAADRPRVDPAQVPRGSGTIMVVDDEMHVRAVCAEQLRDLGYQAVECPDGLLAVEYFREHGDGVDLVLLDVNMPHLGGRGCMEELLKIDREVPIVVFSGYAVTEDVRRMMALGAREFLQKPFDTNRLAVAIDRALSGSRRKGR